MNLNDLMSSSLIYELFYICCSTGFSECTINEDPEYRTFDKMKHKFEGEHSYVLVQTRHLPNNLPHVYIEGINQRSGDDDDDNSQDHGDSSSEENHSRRYEDDDVSDEDDDDDVDDDHKHEEDSEENEGRHRLQELKIRVYDHIVQFKRNLRLLVSIKGILNTKLLLSHFPVVHFQQITLGTWDNIIHLLTRKHL